MLIITVIATSIIFASLGAADNPGGRIVITRNGLNYLSQEGMQYLKTYLHTAHIDVPDQKGGISICHGALTNIIISGIHFDEFSVELGPNGLTLKATDLTISGSLDYSFNCVIYESGSIDFGVSDGSLSLTLLVQRDDDGHPTVETDSCSISISKVNIDFSGFAAKILNLFDGMINGIIKLVLDNNGCSIISDLIKNDLSPIVQKYQTSIDIGYLVEIDYSLVDEPIFSNVDLQVDIKGEFLSVRPDYEKPPFQAPPIPQITEFSRMAYLLISSYPANTAAYVFYEEGFLHFNETPTHLLPANKIIPTIGITTVLFQDLIPEFYNKYPDMNITLNMYATSPPFLKVTPGEARLQGSGVIEFAVYDTNCDNAVVHAFSLEVDGSTEVKVGLYQTAGATNVTGEVESLDLEVTVQDSEIGFINATEITDLIHLLVESLALPLVNGVANVGWPIPNKWVELVDSEITLGDGYILIGTDVIYQPQQ